MRRLAWKHTLINWVNSKHLTKVLGPLLPENFFPGLSSVVSNFPGETITDIKAQQGIYDGRFPAAVKYNAIRISNKTSRHIF